MINGAVAQLVRVSACHAEGRGFESRLLRHSYIPYPKLRIYLIYYFYYAI